MTRTRVLMIYMKSHLCSRSIAVALAKLLIVMLLFAGKRPATPAIAAEPASQPRPCWLSYPAGARVVSLPDRTPWQPRRKAGRDRADGHRSRHTALPPGRVHGIRRPCQSGRPTSGCWPAAGPACSSGLQSARSLKQGAGAFYRPLALVAVSLMSYSHPNTISTIVRKYC